MLTSDKMKLSVLRTFAFKGHLQQRCTSSILLICQTSLTHNLDTHMLSLIRHHFLLPCVMVTELTTYKTFTLDQIFGSQINSDLKVDHIHWSASVHLHVCVCICHKWLHARLIMCSPKVRQHVCTHLPNGKKVLSFCREANTSEPSSHCFLWRGSGKTEWADRWDNYQKIECYRFYTTNQQWILFNTRIQWMFRCMLTVYFSWRKW